MKFLNTISPFSEPISAYKIDEKFEEEKKYIENIPYLSNSDVEFSCRSQSTELQKNASLQKLFKFFKQSLNHYENEILGIEKNNLFITQAWINKSQKGYHHKQHYHPNSIISGVFYFQDLKEVPSITFFRPYTSIVLPEVKKQTNFNARQINITAGKGDLLLFPSNLWHAVAVNNSNQTRFSLAFNTFANVLGCTQELTLLKYGNR